MEYKKFDLQKALKGHPIITRDGHEAILTGLEWSTVFPLAGVKRTEDGIQRLTWTVDGKFTGPGRLTPNDLFLK